ARALARRAPDALCFPAGLDDYDALRAAVAAESDDARAKSLLAMLLFDGRREDEALTLWNSSIASEPVSGVTLRNAAIATYSVNGDVERALALYESALESHADARLVYEADQLRARADFTDGQRLDLLERHRDLVLSRDDAATEYCRLLIDAD